MSTDLRPCCSLHRRWLRLCAAVVMAAAAAACTPNRSETTLLIPVNALCTTCNDFIRCDPAAGPDGGAATDDYVLYHLRPKSMLAQMATIFDYLLQAVRQRKEDL